MKDIIITIIITVIFLIIFLLYGVGIVSAMGSTNVFVMSLVIILFTALIATLVYVMIKRIKEIKEEDKDDISKY